MKKVVAYIRISQEDENVENQKFFLSEWAEKKGFEIVAWFIDENVSGLKPPREREGYKSMLKFCRDNNIKVIIFRALDRLARSLEEGLLELKKLTEEGFNFYFASQEFLNVIEDPMMKKKVISDFLWFAELYIEDIKKKTKMALARLSNEGRLVHRPTIVHGLALYYAQKKDYKDLTREDIDRAFKRIARLIEELKEKGASKATIRHFLLKEFEKVNEYIRELNKHRERKLKEFKVSYSTAWRIIKKIKEKQKEMI
ncbi:MAG: recombinase family protein [Candidatus Njordarchaeota archaeon]